MGREIYWGAKLRYFVMSNKYPGNGILISTKPPEKKLILITYFLSSGLVWWSEKFAGVNSELFVSWAGQTEGQSVTYWECREANSLTVLGGGRGRGGGLPQTTPTHSTGWRPEVIQSVIITMGKGVGRWGIFWKLVFWEFSPLLKVK